MHGQSTRSGQWGCAARLRCPGAKAYGDCVFCIRLPCRVASNVGLVSWEAGSLASSLARLLTGLLGAGVLSDSLLLSDSLSDLLLLASRLVGWLVGWLIGWLARSLWSDWLTLGVLGMAGMACSSAQTAFASATAWSTSKAPCNWTEPSVAAPHGLALPGSRSLSYYCPVDEHTSSGMFETCVQRLGHPCAHINDWPI